MNVLKFFISRSFVFYAVLIAASLFLVDYARIGERIKVRTLNDNMPSNFSHLLQLGAGEDSVKPNGELLKEYANYYGIVTRFFPKLAEAHCMLGFSRFYLGKTDDARVSMQKAAVLNPHFFWFQYNLGVMHYLGGDYKSAAEAFSRARQLRPEAVLLVVKQSVVYQRIFHGATNLGEVIMQSLKSGYSDAYRLLVLSYLKNKDYASVIRHAQEAISLGLGYKEMFLYYTALASYELRHYQSSIQLLKETLTLDSQYSEAYHLLGLNLEAIGQDQTAVQMFARETALKEARIEKHPDKDEARLRIF